MRKSQLWIVTSRSSGHQIMARATASTAKKAVKIVAERYAIKNPKLKQCLSAKLKPET